MDWRPSGGSDSGSSRQLASHRNTPTPVRNQNTLCQPRCTDSQPPTMGAIAGATPKKMVTWLITCCAWAGGNR